MNNYKLSVLLPSAFPEKLEKFLANLKEMTYDFDSLEIVICRDGNPRIERKDNFVYTYYPPTQYRSRFFEDCYRASSAPWIFMANDDILIKTKHWDRILDINNRNPYSLLYFKDNQFNASFSCHPVTSRRVWEMLDNKGLVFPNFQNMGCDTTIWDVIPSGLKVYLPQIEIQHNRDVDNRKLQEMSEDYKHYWTYGSKRDEVKKEILHETGMTDVSVLIGLSTGEHIRKADFLPYFLGLEKPVGSKVTTMHGQSPAAARNSIVKQALANNMTHIFFMDDDMAIPPTAIIDLLKHDKDIVLGLYLMRSFPHFPVAFDQRLDHGYNKYLFLKPDVNGLIEITNGGLGCALIKTDVFKQMPEPWFTLGELQKDGWCDDVSFYNRACDLGFKMYLDTNLCVGHMAVTTVWPKKIDNNWYTVYKYPQGDVKFLQHIPDEVAIAESKEQHVPEVVGGKA